MRLWSIHPMYLDSKGLVALWREGLLAQKVLSGKTKGYKNHPQLDRFKICPKPVQAIAKYLRLVFEEANERGYQFDDSKIKNYRSKTFTKIPVTRGQIKYEFKHLKRKLKQRDRLQYIQVNQFAYIKPHPLFKTVPGRIADWEREIK